MYVGLDVHKKYAWTTVLDEDGNIVQEKRFSCTGKELMDFVSSLSMGDKVVMEASSTWTHIYDLIDGRGIEVLLAHPLQTKAIASARIKTDRISAETLAQLLRANLVPTAYVPSKEIRELRSITRFRAGLVKLQTQLKNTVHALLARNGIEHEFSDLFGKCGMKFLLNLQFSLSKVDWTILLSSMSALVHISTEIDKISKHIATIAKEREEVKLLVTIPGIDYYSATLIVAEIADIKRFPSYKQLCSWAGSVPSIHQSGNTRRYGKITKQGSRWLRWILIQAVQHLVKRPGKLRHFYLRIAHAKGGKVAKVTTARKLLRIIWCMLWLLCWCMLWLLCWCMLWLLC
jgi:transposase